MNGVYMDIDTLSELLDNFTIESVCHRCESCCDDVCFEGLSYSDSKDKCSYFLNTIDI